MYRDTVHSARYIQAEQRLRARPRPRRARRGLAVAVGQMLVKTGERLQQQARVTDPLTEG